MKRLFIGLFLLPLAFLLPISAPLPVFAKENPKKVIYSLEVKDNLINLYAENVSFRTILQDLEKKSGIKAVIHEGVDDKEVSLKIKALPTYAVSILIEKMNLQNFAVIYDPELDSEVIYVLPPSQNINEMIEGKTIIRPAHFRHGKDITTIKGKEILTKTRDAQKMPVRYVKGELLLKFHRGVSAKEVGALLNK